MAHEKTASWIEDSIKASADLSTYQYHAINIASAAVALAGTGNAMGILQNKPISGEPADICFFGICMMLVDGSGAAIAEGDALGSDASGHGVKQATDNGVMVAIALEASTAAGDIITVLAVGPRRY